MELFEDIRRAKNAHEDPSIRALAERFNVHRRTVRQALSSPIPPPRKEVERDRPVLGAWTAMIDGWLFDDRNAPRKQRHTARRVYQRLVEEHGVDVGESTVRAYVAQAKRQCARSPKEVMISQTHLLGAEAEVDFGQISFKLNGTMVEGWMFVMRLSASAKAFHFVSFNQAQEVFLEGHVRAFEHFGGVPGRIRYDNLKTAVVRVLKGRGRTETERFIALRSHYLFESFFCIPGIEGAHEKGGVEGEIGRFRRRFFVPVPDASSLAELNEIVARCDQIDDDRFVDARTISVKEHFALETPHLRPLPTEAFDAGLVLRCRVDQKSRVCVRQSFYSVPVRLLAQRVDVRLSANEIRVLDGGREVARHDRASGRGRETLVLDHYLETLVIKPGALPGSSALCEARRRGVFSETHEAWWTLGRRHLGDAPATRALVEVLLVERVLGPSAMLAGLRGALSIGSVDPQVVIIEARRSLEVPRPPFDFTALARYDRPAPSIAHYDDLLGVK